MPSILLEAFVLLISGQQFARGRKRVHDALLVLRRALRGGNVIRVRKIVGVLFTDRRVELEQIPHHHAPNTANG